jgi:hypothetical protein
MEEWFYVKKDLKAREGIKEVIMRPIWSRFGLRRPKVKIDEAAEACQKAFGTVCFFIGTRDLIQEHITFRVWPLVENWEMPKETVTKSGKGELVRLKYTFRYRDKFDELNDDWIKCIEATSDELLGLYSKAEDNALSESFGGRGKKRLNRVFDAIGFVYPDYCYPLRGWGKKRKTAASATPDEPAPKSKKLKVLTHRPCYIEPAVVPEFCGETSSAIEPNEPIPPTYKVEDSTIMPKIPSSKVVESKTDKDKAEEPKVEGTRMLEVLIPSVEVAVPKTEKSSVTTPRRKRMVNVLDILDTSDSKCPAPLKKVAEADKTQPKADTKQIEVETTITQAEAEAEPTLPTETKLAATEQTTEGITPDINIGFEKSATKEAESLAPETLSEDLDYVIRHASGKKLSEEKTFEAKHYARELKYPKRALVFNGTDEDDFLYCLPDNKELSVCQEMARSMGFPKLKAGLCAMTKGDLADSLAYNSLKVQKL